MSSPSKPEHSAEAEQALMVKFGGLPPKDPRKLATGDDGEFEDLRRRLEKLSRQRLEILREIIRKRLGH